MPARLQSGQAAPRAGRRGRRDRRQYRRAAPQRQARQRSFRRYYRQQGVPRGRNVGRAINRQVRREQHRRNVAGHRRRVQAKTQREVIQKLKKGKTLNARERRFVKRNPILRAKGGTIKVGTVRKGEGKSRGKPLRVRRGQRVGGQVSTGTYNKFAGIRLDFKNPGGIGRTEQSGIGQKTLRLQTAPIHLAIAGYEDPWGMTKATGRGLRDAIVGIPGGAYKAATDPKGAVKMLLDDYKRRYGPLAEGDVKEFRRRVKKDGYTPYAFDALTLAPAAGAIAGGTARAGSLGPRLQRYASAERPALRLSGGTVQKQKRSDNIIVLAGQRRVDRRRARKFENRRDRAEERGAGMPAVQPGKGEVVMLSRRRQGKAQERDVARRKGRALQAMKSEQATELGEQRRFVKSLKGDERIALKYAMQFGIPDSARAVAMLKRHRAQVVANRADSGVRVPNVLRKTNDELVTIDRLLENPQAFTARVRAIADQERTRGIRLSQRDPGLNATQALIRRWAPLAETLGVHRAGLRELRRAEDDLKKTNKQASGGHADKDDLMRARARVVEAKNALEPASGWVKRVMEKAGEEGLTSPGYWPSQKRPTIRFSDRAIGGARAAATEKRYTGALFRTGREDVRPEALEQGFARNIKRRYNWNLVADNFDKHSFEWGRNRTIEDLRDELDTRGIDPNTVAFWNPRRFREARAGREGEIDRGDVADDLTGQGEEPTVAGLNQAVEAAATDVKGLAIRGEDFKGTSGWSVVPKQVYDEIHSDTSPSGKFGRSIDIAKGKQARVLLGLGNVSWLQMQVASNAFLTGIARTGPGDIVKAQIWWRKLSPEERRAVEPYVGVGHFRADTQQTKMGGAATGDLVNAYRAFKQTAFFQKGIAAGRGPSISDLNPMDLLFRADEAQNNLFRRSVLYSQVKRDAYRRIGESTGKAMALEDRLANILKLGPDEQMKAIIRNYDDLERHGQYVNDMLGDYTTYTAKERRILQRNVMFFGFLRFSLRWTFWTMPRKHPVVTGILGHLAQLNTQEVRKILGGDELPFALGRIYTTKNGKLRTLDLQRANPAANLLTQLRAPKDAVNLLPPVFVAALEQVANKSFFRDRDWRVAHETQGRKKSAEYNPDRLRIFTASMLRLAAPYRIAEQVTQEGPHGDDTLIGSRKPSEYKREDIVASIEEDKARLRKKGTGQRILEEVIPFLPQDSRDPEIAAGIREREAERKGKKKKSGIRPGMTAGQILKQIEKKNAAQKGKTAGQILRDLEKKR